MMTDTPAVVLLCLAAVLKCVCSLPVTSIFMLSPEISSYTHTDTQAIRKKKPMKHIVFPFLRSQTRKIHLLLLMLCA